MSHTRLFAQSVVALVAFLGMVNLAAAIDYQVVLSSAEEIPAPNVAGFSPTGSATVSVDTTNGDFDLLSGTYSGMTSNVTVSHLHGLAAPGATAGAIITLANTGGTSGTFSGNGVLSAVNLDGLLDGLTYLNVHTANNGPGEIRAQVVDSDVVVFRIGLDTMQEIPAPSIAGFSPSGDATVVVDISTREVEIAGSYTGMTSNVSVSHLHGLAGPGATAGPIITLANTGGTTGTFSGKAILTQAIFDGLLAGNTYVNVHTANNGPGEIRGQVIPEPTTVALLVLGVCGLALRGRRN